MISGLMGTKVLFDPQHGDSSLECAYCHMALSGCIGGPSVGGDLQPLPTRGICSAALGSPM